MTNNEDRYLRALEIQERKRALLEEELEKERKIQELENPTPPPTEESAEVIEEPPAEVEETSANEMEATEPVTEETPAVTETPKPATVVDTGPKVPGPTPRKDFSSEEKAAMLKRAKAHAAEVAKRKG